MLRQCPECGTQTNGKKSLKNHRLTHGSVQCECGRQFRYLQDMLNHIGSRRLKGRYRTGRFQCAVCLRRFPENYRLSHHQRDTCHTGTRELDSDGDEHQEVLPVLHCPRAVEIRGNYIGLSSPEPTTDLYMVDRAALEGFVATNVQADATFLGCCGEVIDDLVRTLQDTQTAPPELRPRRIIKSGSLGKSTAVKGRSDIDLILMLVAYEEVADLLDNLKDILRTLERYLVSGTTAKHQRTTRYSVQVEVTCSSGHKHDVDILPAVDLLGLGKSPSDVYRTMRGLPADTIHEYSVTLAPLQLEIISALPPKVKNLIKLVKYWKDKKLKVDSIHHGSS